MMCPLLEMAGLRWSIELALASQQAWLACLPSKARKHEVHSCPILPSSKAREACSSRLGTMRCPLPRLAGLRWSLELLLTNKQG
ncbi:hypothetical protein TIFTF001_028662 [Ficus carica]|uniref:Uncharacterized protein n=1 Tax=Ficus carica TaxID=3494 RepID=A0AA88J0D8_FICCA|nr:hypothetical protein TIFTF001_028662 [Ficus carica]